MWIVFSRLSVILCIIGVFQFLIMSSIAHENIVSDQSNNKIFKKIKVPRGTSISIATQVSRPKIFPISVMSSEDAIIFDAVIEMPLWMDVDRMIDAMYNDPKHNDEHERPRANIDIYKNEQNDYNSNDDDDNSDNDEEEFRTFNNIKGQERCILYGYLESFISTILLIAKSRAQSCFLQLICEMHEISSFYFPLHSPSLSFELVHLFLTPSLETQGNFVNDEMDKEMSNCLDLYAKAEKIGRIGQCYKFSLSRECPYNITALIYNNMIPSFLHSS